MAYIVPATDVSDVDVKQFITANDANLTIWQTSVENELKALAAEHGLLESQIDTTVNSIVKEYLVAYYCYMVFRDKIGSVLSDGLSNDKYKQKFEIYGIECGRLRKRITKEMIYEGDDNDDIDDIERAPTDCILVRG